MGYEIQTDPCSAKNNLKKVYVAPGKTCWQGIRISKYRPDLNIEQANELWKKLDQDGYDVAFTKADYCIIMSENAYVVGEGEWWNSALVAAVAELQMGKEKDVSGIEEISVLCPRCDGCGEIAPWDKNVILLYPECRGTGERNTKEQSDD